MLFFRSICARSLIVMLSLFFLQSELQRLLEGVTPIGSPSPSIEFLKHWIKEVLDTKDSDTSIVQHITDDSVGAVKHCESSWSILCVLSSVEPGAPSPTY